MKVAHLSFNDWSAAGGTSVALFRLHNSLKKHGIQSKILCRVRKLNSEDSETIPRSRILEGLLKQFTSRMGFNDLHGVSSFSIPKLKTYQDADIFHLHSLHSGFFNYFALPEITNHKPCIWTLHDAWAFTGHCTYYFECERWKNGCGKCPYPNQYPSIKRDKTAVEWKFKKEIYKKSHIHIVVASKWLRDAVKASILGHFPVTHIPWGIDTDVYQPLNKEESRTQLGLPKNKKIIFSAIDWKRSHNKGGDLLMKALEEIPKNLKKQIALVNMGDVSSNGYHFSPELEVIHLGKIEDEHLKARAYSAADVFAMPSRAETFGLVLIESMACGTPVVGFSVGPIPERVIHGETGYLAHPEDARDFGFCLMKILQNETKRKEMALKCREFATSYYKQDLSTGRYISLYETLQDEFARSHSTVRIPL